MRETFENGVVTFGGFRTGPGFSLLHLALELVEDFLDLPVKLSGLEKLRKGDEKKVLLAALLRRRTSVGVNWIAERLAMGYPGSVSRLLGGVAKRDGMKKRLGELDKMLDCGD